MYLAAGLGTLAVIVVLLVVIVIMLVCVSVRTGKGEPYFSRHDQLEQMFLVHLHAVSWIKCMQQTTVNNTAEIVWGRKACQS